MSLMQSIPAKTSQPTQPKIFSKVIIFSFGLVLGLLVAKVPFGETSPIVPTVLPTPLPLIKYSVTSLESYNPNPSPIQLISTMFTEKNLTAYLANYQTGSKQMSLQLMVPAQATPAAGFPVILMLRGFVDPKDYQTGVGTKNAARYFASHGYATLAPDFLGFGTSDPPPTDTIEARLERPQQLLDLLASLKTLPYLNSGKIGLWGHSNGGQIAISLLEITGKPLPTVLWAPVSKPFPFSVLAYTDESEDGGKALRKVIAAFEKDYDVFDFSLDKYLDRINAPIELHQGTADPSVPQSWSTSFVNQLTDLKKDITLITYPGADHNLRPGWDTAIARSLSFYNKQLE